MIAIPKIVIPIEATPVPTPSIAAVLMEVGSADKTIVFEIKVILGYLDPHLAGYHPV